MIYINPDNPNIKHARQEHYNAVYCFINKKIGNPSCTETKCKICKSKIQKVKKLPAEFINLLSNFRFINRLIVGTPSEIQYAHSELWNIISNGVSKTNWLDYKKTKKKNRTTTQQKFIDYIHNISKVFDYDGWFSKGTATNSYHAYDLAKNLNIRACTYCNRQYILTMTKGVNEKVMRPQFDHWYPQKYYPFLALSFYNLIPSCSVCNSSAKGSTKLYLDQHIHPYVDSNQSNEFRFGYYLSRKHNKHKVILIPTDRKNTKAIDTLKCLNIDHMFNAHLPELDDLLQLKKAYSKNYIESLKNILNDGTLNEKDVYRILFGTEYDSENFSKRPFSKFKKDILGELDI